MKNKFYVMIYGMKNMESYDILPYLHDVWKTLKPREKKKAQEDLKGWIDKELMYQYWGRCEYEMIVSPWPPGKNDTQKKIDVYFQVVPNLDIILKLFKENEGIN